MTKLRFKYNPDNHFMQVESNGLLLIPDIQRVIYEIYDYAKDYPGVSVLFDITKSCTCFNHTELDDLIARATDIIRRMGSIRIAKVISGHREAALGLLFRNDTANLANFEFELFSSRAAALSWLNIQ